VVLGDGWIAPWTIASFILGLAVEFFFIVRRLFLSHSICKYTKPIFELSGKEGFQEFSITCFMLLNLGNLFLYYAKVYDIESTSNPGWTEVFG